MVEKNKEYVIYKRLVKDECCNYIRSKCINGKPCKIMEEQECKYFDEAVKPLLEYKKGKKK